MNPITSKLMIKGLALIGLLALAACGALVEEVPTQAPDLLYTQAAETIVAQLTLQAGETAVAQLTQVAIQPTPTNTATAVPPTATLEPTPTTIPPTATPIPPTNTPAPPTATPQPCNLAGFVSDVTVKDGTQFEPSQSFTKTWRLKNVGTCTWQKTYDIVFVRGNRMDGPTVADLDVVVKPGETVDISLKLRAPSEIGKHTGYWQLRDNNGVVFGLGSAGEKPFWVTIEVIPSRQVVYDLADKYCDATWTSASGALPCPGTPGGSLGSGYVIRENNPQLENGSIDDETALFVRVDDSSSGFIQGKFPAITIKNGDRFRAVIGCAYPNKNCTVRFELLYTLDGSTIQSLGSWDEKNEGLFTRVDIDLSSLRDKSVSLILKVSNLGNSTDDLASWLHPRVVR
jgi:hypothetical protein